MKVVSLFFLSLNIYRALLLRIEHCTAENRNTDFLYIYIIFVLNFLLFDILARVGNLAINVNPFLSFSGIN